MAQQHVQQTNNLPMQPRRQAPKHALGVHPARREVKLLVTAQQGDQKTGARKRLAWLIGIR